MPNTMLLGRSSSIPAPSRSHAKTISSTGDDLTPLLMLGFYESTTLTRASLKIPQHCSDCHHSTK